MGNIWKGQLDRKSNFWHPIERMKKLLLGIIWFPTVLFTLLLSLLHLSSSPNYSQDLNSQLQSQALTLTSKIHLDNILPSVLGTSKTVFAAEDARPALLEHFFARYGSDLYPYASYIVDVSDKYSLDYALIPAMAMQESELCKKIPEDSHNCWGYGIYGDKVVNFASYEEGIERVAKTLKEKYIEDSLTNPDLIMSRWTPSSNGSWSFAVNFFMQEIKRGI
ncbi:hypothetical protein A2773_00845 [Candidatus Gottesmanbacteria bacterium RIFCSPHIGHO2_01_FULL_39_10]|uniref:Mannosyl-glycoprotein endo-beta-N-acetylglucosamidase-like domain-containing protein n=1 Tax=Candidatus Gottesmanbacteria bacterium RIFCSPHIGHO2_01_FULL_39_10 TaxID=1798375 RepID=A0A1F5ZLH3_9BACT|nr:MAG: hypothetical protein A2773_00845 [Candidatus Gottesmanbacteria bacterium RIFCSPHIGHO2_01_FULL_39_10]